MMRSASASQLKRAGAACAPKGLGAAFVVLAFAGVAPAQWTMSILTPPGTSQPEARGVGDGQEAGWTVNGGATHAVLWTGSAVSWVDLNPVGSTFSQCYGVGGGQQVGTSNNRASLWSGTAASWVNLTPAGAGGGIANGVGAGVQVGNVSIASHPHASLWHGTAASWVDLNPAGITNSRCVATNGLQQVGYTSDGIEHAALWSGTAASWIDLNPAGAIDSRATGVTAGGQAGYADFVVGGLGRTHAGLWSGAGASWVDLHPSAMFSSEIDGAFGEWQAGFVLTTNLGGHSHAGVWRGTAASFEELPGGPFTDWFAQGVWADSTTLYVVGSGNPATTSPQAILWTRPIPGPGSVAVLAFGAGLARGRRRTVSSLPVVALRRARVEWGPAA